jgi:hypothetical protein
MVIFSPQITIPMCPSAMDCQVCKNSSNRSSRGTVQWTTNRPPKPVHFAHLSLFGSHLDPLKHFLNFFYFSRCSLSSHFSKWTAFFHLFFFLASSCIWIGPW